MCSFVSRNLDVHLEPLRALAPLSGLFRALEPPDYDLTTSLQPVYEGITNGSIIMTVDELELQVRICLENADDKIFMGSTSLTRDLYASVTLYSCEFSNKEFSLYSVLNARLRSADREGLKPFIKYIWLVMHALDLCPPYEGRLVYRGVANTYINLEEYRPGRKLTWSQFSSCASSIEVQKAFLGAIGDRCLFTIELTTSRARLVSGLSLFPQESEVLLPPNTRLEVVATLDGGGGLTIIQLRELEPSDPILRFAGRTSATAARTPTAAIMPTLIPSPPSSIEATSLAPPPPLPSTGDTIPLRRLTVDQVALLLEGLDLGDYVNPFRAAGIDGDILHFCHTREDLKEIKGIDIPNAWFRKLRAAAEESGVPTSLLEEARARVQQREEEAQKVREREETQRQRQREEAQREREREEARRRREQEVAAAALAERRHQEQQRRLQQEQQQRLEREAVVRRKVEAQQKYIAAKGALEKKTHDGDGEALAFVDEDVAVEEDENKNTLLHWAAMYGRPALVDPLATKRSIIDAQNKVGMTPLMIVCRMGNREVALRLVEHGADPAIKSNLGLDARYWAREKDFDDELEAARRAYLATRR